MCFYSQAGAALIQQLLLIRTCRGAFDQLSQSLPVSLGGSQNIKRMVNLTLISAFLFLRLPTGLTQTACFPWKAFSTDCSVTVLNLHPHREYIGNIWEGMPLCNSDLCKWWIRALRLICTDIYMSTWINALLTWCWKRRNSSLGNSVIVEQLLNATYSVHEYGTQIRSLGDIIGDSKWIGNSELQTNGKRFLPRHLHSRVVGRSITLSLFFFPF